MLAGKQSAVLFELRGDHPGSVNVLSEEVFRIGSDVENDLVLKDREIALYQAEIRRVQERFVIRNLSMEVPAYLNGEAFEVATLHKGDILTLSDSMYRFVEFGETLRKKDLWEPVGGLQSAHPMSRLATLRRISFLSGLTVFAVALVVLIMWSQREEPGSKPPSRWQETPVPREDPRSNRIRTLYNHGVDLLSARRWDEAVLVFESIRKDIPNYKETETRYQLAMMESTSLDALNQGKGLYSEGELEKARLRLETIPEQSVYDRESRQLVREINKQIVGVKIEEAEENLRNQDWAGARSKAKAVLFLSPNEKRAVNILRVSDRLRTETPGKTVEAATALAPQKTAAVRRGTGSRARKRSTYGTITARRGTPQRHMQRAVSKYRQGDPVRSIDYLKPVLSKKSTLPKPVSQKAQGMRNDLLLAKTYFDQARQLQEQKQYASAVEMWEKFLEKDRNLSGGGEGKMFLEASAHLSTIYYQRGKKEYDRGNLGEAFFYWNMAGQVHEKDRDVQKGLEQLASSAQEFYREGYSLYDYNPERAEKKWKEVLQIVPSDNPYHRKARRRIQKGSLGGPVRSASGQGRGPLTVPDSTQQFFREGYCIQYVNPEGALARWLEILDTATPNDPYYQKAKKQIERTRMVP